MLSTVYVFLVPIFVSLGFRADNCCMQEPHRDKETCSDSCLEHTPGEINLCTMLCSISLVLACYARLNFAQSESINILWLEQCNHQLVLSQFKILFVNLCAFFISVYFMSSYLVVPFTGIHMYCRILYVYFCITSMRLFTFTVLFKGGSENRHQLYSLSCHSFITLSEDWMELFTSRLLVQIRSISILIRSNYHLMTIGDLYGMCGGLTSFSRR